MSISQLQIKRDEKLIAMGQMAASLAHEIRNPLGSMELNIGILKRTLKDNIQVGGYLSELQRSVQTLNHIVTNSLQFTKEIKPRKQSFLSGNLFLKEICSYFGSLKEGSLSVYETGNVEISFEEIGEEKFLLDPYLLGQVLLNLISNALQASEINHTEKLKGEVKVILDHTNSERFSIAISDDGPGIPKENLNQIFDPFFTTKEKGTGLGLAIVNSIVSAHGGEIVIEEILEGGTNFKIIFDNKI